MVLEVGFVLIKIIGFDSSCTVSTSWGLSFVLDISCSTEGLLDLFTSLTS